MSQKDIIKASCRSKPHNIKKHDSQQKSEKERHKNDMGENLSLQVSCLTSDL